MTTALMTTALMTILETDKTTTLNVWTTWLARPLPTPPSTAKPSNTSVPTPLPSDRESSQSAQSRVAPADKTTIQFVRTSWPTQSHLTPPSTVRHSRSTAQLTGTLPRESGLSVGLLADFVHQTRFRVLGSRSLVLRRMTIVFGLCESRIEHCGNLFNYIAFIFKWTYSI